MSGFSRTNIYFAVVSASSRLALILAASTIALLCVTNPASGQSPGTYISLVERYATGDEERALMELSR